MLELTKKFTENKDKENKATRDQIQKQCEKDKDELEKTMT